MLVGPCCFISSLPGPLDIGIKKHTNNYILLVAYFNKYYGEKYGKHTESIIEIIIAGNLPWIG